MPASAALMNALATHGATLVTHVGLVNELGVELSGGGYARQPVTFTAVGATFRPSTNETFSIEAGDTVGGWRGYSALVAGTDFGGDDLTQETYGTAGTYTLLAASTGYPITAAP